MENGPTEYAAEHAGVVAREVVRLGLAEVEPVRRCLKEYTDLVRAHGPRGTFTQLLLVRGLIDRGGFDRLQAAAPPDTTRLSGSGSAQSQVFRLPPGAVSSALFRQPSSAPALAAQAGPAAGERTVEFGAVIDSVDPDAEASGGRTTEFAAVIPPGKDKPPEAPGEGLESSDELELPPDPPTEPARAVLRPPSSPSGGHAKPATRSVARPPSAAPAAPAAARPGSAPARPASRASSGSKGSASSGRSSRTPDPAQDEVPAVMNESTIAMREDEVLEVPLEKENTVVMRDDEVFDIPAKPPASVKSTTDSRTPGPAPPAGGYDLAPASEGDFYISDESAEAAPSEPQAGQQLGGHELLRVLGRGGMGVIYVARKRGQEQQVALKVLMGVNDPGADRRRQRFRAEFEALRRLEHPNIVRVFDFGREGAYDWYTMEYVDGKDFEKLLYEDALEHHEKLDVFGQVCLALGHAHERNVIHRDVKPQNVLVDGQGSAHVLDFGLAKILDQGVGMTRTGSSLGTPFYMAPEQLKSAKHVDARADVFALGVMLYEIIAGQRPFMGETAAEVGNKILNEDPALPSKVRKNVHSDVEAICLKALEKAPERRYGSAAALYEDFVRYRKGQDLVGARGAQGSLATLRRWAARNRAALVGGLVASAVFVPALVLLVCMHLGWVQLPFGPKKAPVEEQVKPPR